MSFQVIFPATLAASLLLAGCSSLPADLGRGDVDRALGARGLASPGPDERALRQPWLAAPLSLDRAIQLALLGNPELRAETAQLGIEAADVYEAGRLANPLLSATWLSGGDEPHAQLTLGLALDFTDLLFLHARGRIADAEFERTKLDVGSAALDLAADVEAAYRRVAAAGQQLRLRTALAQAARASATLAQRYHAAGNLKRRDLALEQAAAAQAELQLEQARLALTLARADFARLLGLTADDGDGWTLAEPLSAPDAPEAPLRELLELAQTSRLDLAAARRHADAVAARYGLARRTALLDGIEVGAEREREYDGGVHAGPSARLALPLFDWGRGRKARGAAELDAAEAALAARALDVDREVSGAYAHLAEARDRVERYRDALIPARETVVEETRREANYMLVDVFALLAARQQAHEAYAGYLDALRDWWVARAALARAVGRRLPGEPPGHAALRFDGPLPRLDAAPAADGADLPGTAMPAPHARPDEHEHEHGTTP